MANHIIHQTHEKPSDDNEEKRTYGEVYSGSGSEYSSDSSSINPPRKRKPNTSSEYVSNSPLLVKLNRESNMFLRAVFNLDKNEILSKRFYTESSSDESNEEENQDSVSPQMKVTWGPVTGKNLKSYRYSEYTKISDTVYQNYHLKTPYDFFKLLFSNQIIDHIVVETNRYAEQCIGNSIIQSENWHDTNKQEMEVFIGILMFMILTLLPSVKSFWDGMQAEFYQSKVLSKMKRDRFMILLKMWHFNNNEVKSNDRMGKLTPIITILEKNFQDAINPGEKLYVDETVIPFNRGLKAKHHYHFGLRCIHLCLSNGYAYKLLVHFGGKLQLKNNLPSSVIMSLMKGSGLLNEGRILFTKEHYTSVTLAQELLKHKTYLVGPLNSKKKLNPKQIMKQKLRKGETIALESSTGIIVQKWKNAWNSDVLILSTKYRDEMVIDFDKKGIMSERPRSVYELSKCTSSLHCESFDKMLEQMEEYHIRLAYRMKWYQRLAIEFLIQKALINAYILHQDVTNSKISLLDFRKQVTNHLLAMNSNAKSSQRH